MFHKPPGKFLDKVVDAGRAAAPLKAPGAMPWVFLKVGKRRTRGELTPMVAPLECSMQPDTGGTITMSDGCARRSTPAVSSRHSMVRRLPRRSNAGRLRTSSSCTNVVSRHDRQSDAARAAVGEGRVPRPPHALRDRARRAHPHPLPAGRPCVASANAQGHRCLGLIGLYLGIAAQRSHRPGRGPTCKWPPCDA